MYAAASIASVLRNEITQSQAICFYDQSLRFHYLTLLVFVAAIYYQPRNLDNISPDMVGGPAQLVTRMDDLARVEEGMRNMVTQHSVSLLSKAEEGIRISMEQHKERRNFRETEEDVFLDIWNGMFDSIPAINGLHLVKRPRLGVAPASKPSAPVAGDKSLTLAFTK
jgi:hypothetical protein